MTTYKLKFTSDTEISVDSEIVDFNEDTKYFMYLQSVIKRGKGKDVPFKVQTNKPITSVYLINEKLSDEKKNRTLEYVGRFIPSPTIIFVKDLESDKVKDYLQKEIVEKKVRAITTVGLETPRDFCKDNRILYLLDLNPDKFTFNCVKSN